MYYRCLILIVYTLLKITAEKSSPTYLETCAWLNQLRACLHFLTFIIIAIIIIVIIIRDYCHLPSHGFNETLSTFLIKGKKCASAKYSTPHLEDGRDMFVSCRLQKKLLL